MLIKFSVVVFAGPNTRVAIVGSIVELGEWNPQRAIPLYPHEVPYSPLVPTYFSAVVNLTAFNAQRGHANKSRAPSFRYKFIKWEAGFHSTAKVSPVALRLPPTPPKIEDAPDRASVQQDVSSKFLYCSDQLRLPAPLANVPDNIGSLYGNSPAASQEIIWEGTGPHHDRAIYLSATQDSQTTKAESPLIHVCKEEYMIADETGGDCYYALPPADFMDPIITDAGMKSEFIATTRYYDRVKELRCIHFNEIIPRIYCGSCPRRISHLLSLRDNYNVRTVFCLQSISDIEKNWIDDEAYPSLSDRNPLTLQKIYNENNISLIHIPTEDMCTESRAAMMAQAAWLLAGILLNRPRASVYVHCNAGVGRAVACVSAFLHFCLGLSEAHTLHLIRSRRPVAYFDPVALRSGKCDFDAKFGAALTLLPVLHTHCN